MNKKLSQALILAIIGLLLLAAAGWTTLQHINLQNNGIVVQATVVNILEKSDEDSTCYTPVIRFKTIEGQEITFENNVCTGSPGYEIGEQVNIIYQPENPTQAAIQGQTNLLGLILGGMAALVLFGAVRTIFTQPTQD